MGNRLLKALRKAPAAALFSCALLFAAEQPAAEPNLDWRINPLHAFGPVSYYVAPGFEFAGARPEDAQLAEWALGAWERAADGLLCFHPSKAVHARLRVYWGMVDGGLGRMRSIPVNGLRGGEVYVRACPSGFDAELDRLCREDPLMRDAFLYRTLLHEIGHVLGLPHSLDPDDAMYFGGDFLTYYRRYRARLRDRGSIRDEPGLSQTDLARIRKLYPPELLDPPKPPKLEDLEGKEQGPQVRDAVDLSIR